MRIPSVGRIESVSGCDRETAIKVRRILDGRDNPEDLPGVAKWVRECYSRPWDVELQMSAVDELLGTCGVEAIKADGAWVSSFWMDTVAVYCNTGDSYGGTILYDTGRGTFHATSWADWLETAERNRQYSFR